MKRYYRILCMLLMLASVGAVCAEEGNKSGAVCAEEGNIVRDVISAADGRQYTELQMDSLRETDDFVQFGLVIIEPGDVLYSVLGHACLRMRCEALGMDYIFTCEGEDVTHQIVRFMLGTLRMGMFEVYTESYLQLFREANRCVTEYAMHLPREAKLRLCALLEKESEGDDMPYDYYHYGCARSIVKDVRRALGDTPIEYAVWPEKYVKSTQRELCYEAGYGHAWAQFATLTLIGNGPDDASISNEDKLLAPRDLLEVWQAATVDGHQLVDSEGVVLVASSAPTKSVCITPLWIAISLAVLALLALASTLSVRIGRIDEKHRIVLFNKISDGLTMIVVALMSVVMSYLVVVSSLPCTDWNWLIVPFNILPLLVWSWRRYWSLPYSVILVVWILGMWLAPHRLVTPAHIVLVVAYILTLLRQVEWKRGALSERKLRKL